MYAKYIKRLLDIILSAMALIVLSPVLIIISLLVKKYHGTPILFKQERAGKNEKPFNIYKFRTMSNATDENGNPLPDEERLTKFGKLLRATSLDELSELVNILKGEMSIVGPRPLPTNYLPYYTEEERKRHTVRPGLTGLAQVNGRNSISWEERFALDLEYIDNITFMGDVKIIADTVLKVLKRADIGERNVGVLIDFNVYRSK